MKIRLAGENDKESILSLLDELINEVNKKMGSTKNHKGNEKRFALYLETVKRDDVKIFIAEDYHTLVGLAELHLVPIIRRGYHQGVIESFVIKSNMRGKGIGSALMQEIFDFCKRNDISVIKVNSGIELSDAHRFYEKHGGKFTEKLFRIEVK